MIFLMELADYSLSQFQFKIKVGTDESIEMMEFV